MALDRRSFVRRSAFAAGIAAFGSFPAISSARDGDGDGDASSGSAVRVRVWGEGTAPKSIYPRGVEGAIGEDLARRPGLVVTQAQLDDPNAGLADADLDATDCLVWWGRLRHDDLPEDRCQAVVERVKAGRLGLVALHASFASRPFRALMGTGCEPDAWSDDAAAEHVAIAAPEHPIARGVAPFVIPRATMYGEPFAVPKPESVVFVSSWDGAESFRSGLTWRVGAGRVAYFRPGHDSYPVLFHPSVRRVIANASLWAAGNDHA